jgi:hypothetical protein
MIMEKEETMKKSAVNFVGLAVADAISRGVDYLTRPRQDATLSFLSTVVPLLPTMVEAVKASLPADLDGPKVKQVRRELAAEEAHLKTLFAEQQARLVVEFGPRLEEARLADEGREAVAQVHAS